MAANAACDWPSAIRHSRSVRGSTTSHHAIAASRREARGGHAGGTSVSQSFAPDRSLCSLHIRRGSRCSVGTTGELSRKMARPAGLEPATIGLEGRAFRSGGTTRYNAVQSGTAGRFLGRFSGRFQVDPGGGRAAVPDRRAQGRTGGQDRRSAAEAGSRSGRAWPVARAPTRRRPPSTSARSADPRGPGRSCPTDRLGCPSPPHIPLPCRAPRARVDRRPPARPRPPHRRDLML